MAPSRRNLLTGTVAGAAALAGVGAFWWRQPEAAPVPPGTMDALWALRLERPEGGELVLATLRGQPLLINFWATWCAPCVRELPEIERFYQNHRAIGWQVVGLAIDRPAPVRDFLGRVPLSFPVALAGIDGTELVRALGNPQGGLPFTVLIGADGRVLRRRLGETSYAELADWVRIR